MYERSAIVLERYFENLLGNNKQINLKTNFQIYSDIVEEMLQYDTLVTEEEKVIQKFDEVAGEIQTIQTMQERLHKSNEKLEEDRNVLFGDLDQNPNTLDNKLKKIEMTFDKNNEQLKDLREKYVKALVIFIERQKERNRYTRNRREKEAEHIRNVENATKIFQEIDVKMVQTLKKFLEVDDENVKDELINLMLKNGKNEKVGFDEDVITKAVEVRIDIAKREAKCYIEIYDKTKRFLSEIDSENLKLARYERLLKNTSVVLSFLEAEKEYIIGFLDNERMNAFNGAKIHKKMMEEACKNFEADIVQIDNLFELILKETTNKATKKMYKELYNKTYLKDIEDSEKSFEREMTNVKINVGTLINTNYWRMEGIKHIYEVFDEEVSSEFEKDLSEFKIEEEETQQLNKNYDEDNKFSKDDYIIDEEKDDDDYMKDKDEEDYDEDEYDDDDESNEDGFYIDSDDDEEDADYINDKDKDDDDEYEYDDEDDEDEEDQYDYDDDDDEDEEEDEYDYDEDDEDEEDEYDYDDDDEDDDEYDEDIEDEDEYDDHGKEKNSRKEKMKKQVKSQNGKRVKEKSKAIKNNIKQNTKQKSKIKEKNMKTNPKNVKNNKKEDKSFLDKIFGNKSKGKRLIEK